MYIRGMVDTPLVGDLITVRYRGEWVKGFVISVEGRDFTVRPYDDAIPDLTRNIGRFQTVQQRGWWLEKVPNTCQG